MCAKPREPRRCAVKIPGCPIDIMKHMILLTTNRNAMIKRKADWEHDYTLSRFEEYILRLQDGAMEDTALDDCTESALSAVIYGEMTLQAASIEYPLSYSTLKRLRRKYFYNMAKRLGVFPNIPRKLAVSGKPEFHHPIFNPNMFVEKK